MESISENKYLCIVDDSRKLTGSKIFPVHRWVKREEDEKEYSKYICEGRKLHIHHIDHNSLNNSPSNLKYLSISEHYKEHPEFQNYNGSKEQKLKLREAWERGSYKNVKFFEEYNKLGLNKEVMSGLNKEDWVKQRQMFGKAAKMYNSLKSQGIEVNKENWDKYTGKKGSTHSVMKWDMLENWSIELKDLQSYIDKYEVGTYELKTEKNSYPQQKVTKFNMGISRLRELGLEENEENYENIRKEFKQRLPHWKTIKNHKMVSKKLIEQTEEFYCVTVPEFGNFMMEDGFGNGICSSNCHISVLLLTLFQKLYPELIEQGRVFYVDAPLFVGRSKTTEYYGESLKDLQSQFKGKFESITRVKGWGEASPQLLRKFAFDPATRKIKKVGKSYNSDLKYFHKIVGNDVTVRKELLASK